MSSTEDLAVAALQWLSGSARADGDGLTWFRTPDPTLYSGDAGVVLALLEAHRHFDEGHWADLAAGGARTLAAQLDTWDHHSLYFGITGTAVALHAVAEQLGDSSAAEAVTRALVRVRAAFDGERWGPMFELMGGNAGIALGALRLGDVQLAELAIAPYLRAAEPTTAGVTWQNRPDLEARRHHVAHGTLGVAYALSVTADATGRRDLMDLALAAVADVVSRNEADASGFLVPHSDPQQAPERIGRYNYGWCHGPAGDAQVFRLLGQLTGDARWRELQDRCWHTVLGSGLPERLRPGFWDNNGRCCGTAGVLALACDRAVEAGDGQDFAAVLMDDLSARATVDAAGARWSNHEFREDPPELAPRLDWAMGNAGIVRELLRFARIEAGGDPSYAVQWPDQPVAGVTLA